MPIKLNSAGGGSVTLDVPSMTTANTLTLPAATGNILTSASAGVDFIAPPTFKTTNHTVTSGQTVMADTSGGAFTVTLPASPATGDIVEVQDATNSFGAFNLTVAGNGNTITGNTFSGSSSIVLNAPGNNAVFTYVGSGVWKCVQVAQGHWSTQVASSSTAISFTGLPGLDMDFRLLVENFTGGGTDPGIRVGYGATPTYLTGAGDYYGLPRNATDSSYKFAPSGTLTNVATVDITVYTKSKTIIAFNSFAVMPGVSTTVSGGQTVTALTTDLTAIQFRSATAFSGTLHLKWMKHNV